jgi:two-component system cell cycle sensor histidine kinase/response regulator CckA
VWSNPAVLSTLFIASVAVALTVALLSAAVVSRLLRERQRATAALEHSEALFRSLVENAIDIVAVLDHAGRFLYVSPSAERILGYKPEQLKGRVSLDLVSDEDKPLIAATFAAGLKNPGTSQSATCTMVDRDGKPHILETRGSAVLFGGTIHAVLSLRDITAERRATEDQQRLQGQLVHAQKLEAFGTLASGIAHDFNNLLTPILGGAELGQGMLAKESPVRELFERIEDSARRARALVQRMVLLGKSSAEERKTLDLSELVREASELLRASLPRTVQLISSISSEKLPVIADELQLQQALLNLTTNAAHAMRHKPGELTVRVAQLEAGALARKKHPILRSGAWAHLEISDTGEGMDEETIRRAFEPFFSTHGAREVGGGAGLGLSVVHGVVNGHGGVIDLSSTLERGTRVDIYLPLQQQPAAATSAEARKPQGDHKACILLVDDEPAVASVCRELLRMLGYEVDVSTDPREALERFAQAPDRFDLVVTDHSMPHLTGLQLAEALMPLRAARVPIVLTTGFAQDDVLNGTSRSLVSEIVPKPYAIEELESAIQRALAARPS